MLRFLGMAMRSGIGSTLAAESMLGATESPRGGPNCQPCAFYIGTSPLAGTSRGDDQGMRLDSEADERVKGTFMLGCLGHPLPREARRSRCKWPIRTWSWPMMKGDDRRWCVGRGEGRSRGAARKDGWNEVVTRSLPV